MRLWDTQSRESRWLWFVTAAHALAFSSDQRTLAVAAQDGVVRLVSYDFPTDTKLLREWIGGLTTATIGTEGELVTP